MNELGDVRIEALRQPAAFYATNSRGILLHVNTERDGRAPRIVLSPRSTRMVATGLQIESERPLMVLASGPLLTVSILVGPFIVPDDEELQIPIYNGGINPYYLSTGDWFATLVRL